MGDGLNKIARSNEVVAQEVPDSVLLGIDWLAAAHFRPNLTQRLTCLMIAGYAQQIANERASLKANFPHVQA